VSLFDSFEDAFYEGYWSRYTHLEAACLIVEGSGRVTATLVRQTPDGATIELGHWKLVLVAGRKSLSCHFPLETGDRAGRVFVTLSAGGPGCNISSLAWGTAIPPKRNPVLDIAICTFNNERFLEPNLEKLIDLSKRASIGKIWLVNQGVAFKKSRLCRLITDHINTVVVIEQANLGGAGGFSRAMYEFFLSEQGDFILLMDDDVHVETIHIETAIAFIAYAIDDCCLGGQMIDALRPDRMSEGGVKVRPDNSIEQHFLDLDLQEQRALARLGNVPEIDYNPWWFCVIPRVAIERSGLPLPIFIRHDDMEFGYRSKIAGIASINLPPVSIRHSPFYARASRWQEYYDVRNRLLIASIYNESLRLDPPRHLLARALVHIIRYDYEKAALLIAAVQDYLRPREDFQGAGPELHSKVTQLSAAAPSPVWSDRTATSDGPKIESRHQHGGSARLHLAWETLRNFIGFGLAPHEPVAWARTEDGAASTGRPLPNAYFTIVPVTHKLLVFTYNKAAARRLLAAALLVVADYALNRRRAANTWRRAHRRMASFEGWNEAFARNAR